jgi:HAD superfamily hydrolase (TIGR01549 family)
MTDIDDRRACEALLFDMDGVLIHGRATLPEVYANAADDALAELGVDVPDAERARFRQPRFDGEMADRCRAVGLDPGAFWTTRERLASERANRRIGTDPRALYDDTAVLAELPGPLGLVSNSRAATVEYVAAELFPDRFAVAVGRDPTLEGYRRRKPEPYYIERALDRLGVEEALYVGDREKDLLAARRAGIDGALVRREHNRDVTLDDSALELDGLRELPALLER